MHSKSNILFIYHVSSIGGGSFCLLNIIRDLDRKKFNPIVLLKSEGPLVTELKKLNIKIIINSSIITAPYNSSLLNLSTLSFFYFLYKSQKVLASVIKKELIEIVYLNTMMMYPYAITTKKMGLKVVIHMRENWPSNEHQIQFRNAKRIISKYVDKIIAINKTSSSILDLPEKTEVIYDWIEFENRNHMISFSNLFGKDYKSFKIFVSFSGSNKIKGALEIIKTFVEKIHGRDLRLLIVGINDKNFDNSQSLKSLIKKLLRFLKLPVYSDKIKSIAQADDRVIFISPTKQVKQIIEKSFCYLSYPTIPHAILPIAESLYLKNFFISADTLEAREYSVNLFPELLFKINDLKDFENKIHYLLNNEKIIGNNIKKACPIIKKTFERKANKNKINNLLNNLNKYV